MGYYYRIQLRNLVLHNTEFQGSQDTFLFSLKYTENSLSISHTYLSKTVTTIKGFTGLEM